MYLQKRSKEKNEKLFIVGSYNTMDIKNNSTIATNVNGW